MFRTRQVMVAVAVVGALVSGCSEAEPTERSSTIAAGGVSSSTSSPTTVPTGEVGADGVGDPYYAGLGNGGYDVESYDLDIEWLPDDGVIDATATVTFVPTIDLRHIVDR